ncbi:unnamed protein product [Callosobruchus maculatus]|uniref:Major facilitator superfamily (MFS) profile domain-containing protein n=1 Tax=Callosobruchus maculatus TaxID=64391 RepID=A0A653DFE2_CALMS|nr:unnamed protein product [Callosobruchus maculatus]
MHVVWGKWAPPLERSRLATIGFSGSYFGTVVSMPVCSYLASTLGWPSIFYCFGTIGLIWCTIWMTVIKESPKEDPEITDRELKYITESLKYVETNKPRKIPWRSLATSMPVWAITVSHFSENWGFYTLLTELPKYMKNVLNFDMTHTGFMSALPYIAMFVMTPLAGQMADWVLVRGTLNTTQVRKVFNCSGFIAQTVFMLAAAYWFSPVGTTFCLTMAVGLGAFSSSGFSVNHLDIAPQYAGILFGFGNTFGTLPGIISPILTGHMVTDETDVEQWRIVFFVTSGVFLFGSVFYAVFASGELQPWAVETAPLKPPGVISKTNEPLSYANKSFQQSDEVHS